MSGNQLPNLGLRLRKILVATIVSILAVAVVAFGLDYLIFRARTAKNWNPYGSVTVDHYYAVGQKSGKTEFLFDPPQPQTCIHTLFPHSDYLPCWYLSRHPEQRTNI